VRAVRLAGKLNQAAGDIIVVSVINRRTRAPLRRFFAIERTSLQRAIIQQVKKNAVCRLVLFPLFEQRLQLGQMLDKQGREEPLSGSVLPFPSDQEF
jgi:hypothetical protein